jgi:hypothetical protein
MSCPLCGAPSPEGSSRCPQCGWASAEALAAEDDLPVYGEAPPPTEPRPNPDARLGRRRGLLVAVAVVAALVTVGAAVSALTGQHDPTA